MLKTKFVHLATVAFISDESGIVQRAAVALCHSKDNFNRRIDRVKAEGRLNSSRFAVDFGNVHEKEFVQKLRESYNPSSQSLIFEQPSSTSLGMCNC